LLGWCVFWLDRLVLFEGGKADASTHFFSKLLFDPKKILRLPDQTHQSGSLIRRCSAELARSSASELLELTW